MQLDENNDPMICTIFGARMLSIFQILVLGIPAVALTLLSIVLCPCVVLGCGNTNRERGEWSNFSSEALTMLLFYCCLLPMNHTERLQILCSYPLPSIMNQWSTLFLSGDRFCRRCSFFRSLALAC